MPEAGNLIVFLAATIVVNLTPGPDMLYTVTRSISQGKKAGIVSALGIGAGCIVHTFATAFGLSALLMSSAIAFDAIKFIGAAYLIYLGLKMFFTNDNIGMKEKINEDSLWSIFRQGVITNVFNPKVALFFLAFLPQFVDSSRGSVALQIVILGSIFILSGTIWTSLAALLAGFVGDRLKSKPVFWRVQKWFTGSIFVALGARIAFSSYNE